MYVLVMRGLEAASLEALRAAPLAGDAAERRAEDRWRVLFGERLVCTNATA
eukprot:CAMPEP_0173444272 /NCGR_PEP_ID=MMETSP1357-20121228/31840_1 /TAXON_ID=77926 /ORGANISM="Hemiselmis rufescens, Strain PCC563" /LENGTH=50 /DNA_ID=CAMNT_0014410303 /DNA_START=164 /DNA_END=312 /DNA_ORIENTATION=+